MALDGIILQQQSLKIRRPKDYQPLGIGKGVIVTVLMKRAYLALNENFQ